jgi:hypothetical protein
MRNYFLYLILIALIIGCEEEKSSPIKKVVKTPPMNKGIINWAFFNSDGFQNISFPVWFNDTVISNRNIEKIHFSMNKFEALDDSTFQDTLPSALYEVHFSNGNLDIFYVKRFAQEIKIEEQWFKYRKDKDSLGYSLPNVTNNVIYEENGFLPIFSTLKNAAQYKRLKLVERDSSTIQYLNTLSAEKEMHIFILDSANWNVHFIDQNFEHPEKNTFYYGFPSQYIESFRIKNLVEKEQLTSYKYFDNGCIYQRSTYSNGFENRRTFLYDSTGLLTSFVDSLIVEPNDCIESIVSKIDYKEGLPQFISSFKSQDSLYSQPIKEVRFNYTINE